VRRTALDGRPGTALAAVAIVIAVVSLLVIRVVDRDSPAETGPAAVGETAGTDPVGVGSAEPVESLVRLDRPLRGAAWPRTRSLVIVPPDARVALQVAEELAAIGPRVAGTDADGAGRALIAEAFAAAGWSVAEESFDLPDGGQSANVVAWLGHGRPASGYILVGAHHDTVPGSPGANDNASGIGVLVAVAQRVATEDLPMPVVLVAFGAEERQPGGAHHIGSEVYAAAHADDVAAMISVDMVGNTAVRGAHCACWYRDGSRVLADRLVAVGEAIDVPISAAAMGAISDHVPFARRGVPSVLLWSGPDPRYHSPADTAEHLRLHDLRRAAALVAEVVREGP
jgi:aminopeptidase YwaD